MNRKREIGAKSFVSIFLIFIMLSTLASGILVFWSNTSNYLNTGETRESIRKIADRLHRITITIISNDPRPPSALEALHQEAEEIRKALSGQPPAQPFTKSELIELASKLNGIIRKLNEDREDRKDFSNKLVRIISEIESIKGYYILQNNGENRYISSTLKATKDFWSWVGPNNLLLVLLIAIVLFIGTRENVLKNWFGHGGEFSFEAFGVKIAGTSLSEQKAQLANTQKKIDEEISKQYQKIIADKELDKSFDSFCTMIYHCLDERGNTMATTPHRRTLFVPTYMSDHLIQAAEYRGYKYDSESKKFGRIFSVRYGIIGKAWRLRCPLYNPSVDNDNDALVRDWGLTRKEASKQGTQKRALLAFPIPDDDDESDPLGVIYLEGFDEHSFSGSEERKKLDEEKEQESLAVQIFEKAKGYHQFHDFSAKLSALKNDIEWSRKSLEGDGR